MEPFVCPECQTSLQVLRQYDGTERNCPKCGKRITIRLSPLIHAGGGGAAAKDPEVAFDGAPLTSQPAKPQPSTNEQFITPQDRIGKRLKSLGYPEGAKAHFWLDTAKMLIHGLWIIFGFLSVLVFAVSASRPYGQEETGVMAFLLMLGTLPVFLLSIMLSRIFGATAEFIVAACEWFGRQEIRGDRAAE